MQQCNANTMDMNQLSVQEGTHVSKITYHVGRNTTSLTHIHTINEIQNNTIWNNSTSTHLSISSLANAVKTPSFSPATLFIWMWEHTKFNEHQWKLVFIEEQEICTYNKTDWMNSLERQKHGPLHFSIHGCKRRYFFSLAKIYYKAQNITQLHGCN